MIEIDIESGLIDLIQRQRERERNLHKFELKIYLGLIESKYFEDSSKILLIKYLSQI